MFDWLFGKKRETDYDTLEKTAQEYNQSADMIDKFYKDNFSDEKWNSMDNNQRMKTLYEYGDMANKYDVAQKSYDDYNKLFNQEEKDYRHAYFGNGMLGSILNPIAQTGMAALDLATGNYEGRDVMSDLGAAGQTALSIIPGLGAVANAAKLGKVASSLGKASKAMYTLPGSTATGAVFGGLEELRQSGSDTNFGDVLNSAGTGAVFGAAVPMANNFVRNRGAKNMVTKYMSDPRYNQASEALQNAGAEEIGNFVKRVARDGSPALQRMYGGIYRNALPQSTFGKLVLGGGALYGGSRLLGGGQPQPQTIEDYYAMQQGGLY